MRDSHYRITLDITKTQSQVSLSAKQGETSRKIYINLVEGSHPYEIDGSKCSAVFHGVKSDGTKLQEYCIIEGDKIRYDFTEQTTAAVGLMECDITLHSIETGVIASPRFNIIVDNRAIEPDVLSEDQAITFDEVLTQLGNIRNAESGRVSAEEGRVTAEEIRVSAEQDRQNKEAERVAAEIVRDTSEGLRNTAEGQRETRENERVTAEAERQAMWNNSVENPEVWKLDKGCYYVKGKVWLSEEKYVTAPLSVLYVGAYSGYKSFVLYTTLTNGAFNGIIMGTTNGKTADLRYVELSNNKTEKIDITSNHEQYPSAKAVYDLVLNEATKFQITIDSPKIWELNDGCYYVSGFVAIDSEAGFYVYDKTLLYVATDEADTTKKRFVLFLAYANALPYDVISGTTDGTNVEWDGIVAKEFCETTDNKVTRITEKSTDTEYPSAKAVYDLNSNLFEQSKNLFNGLFEPGRANDSPNANPENESRSEWIAVEQGETYTFSHSKIHYSFMICGKSNDGTLTLIFDGKVYSEGHTFEVPEGVTHIRFSAYNTVLDSNNIQFEKGSEATAYEPYKFTIKQDLLPSDSNVEIPENVETTDNKVTTIDKNSTDTQYPSAKAVYDLVGNIDVSGGTSDGSTVIENSAFQELPTGKNLLNRKTDTVGYNLTETGELASASNYEVTDFISVVGNEGYHLSNSGVGISARTICFYDTHKNVLSFNTYLVPGQKIIAPEIAQYVRFSFAKSNTEVQFEQSEIVTEYEAFVGKEQIGYNELYIPKRAIPSEVLKCMTKKAGGKNLLDRTVSEVGKVLLATGELSSNSSAETSDFIPVAFGDNLYISGIPDGSNTTVLATYAIYDENKEVIKFVNNAGTYGENPLPIPRHARFVRYSYRTKGTNIQIERGTEATEYEEYIGVPALDNELIGVKMPNDLPYSLNPWFGKRLVVDGDSITHDQGKYNYWQFIAAQLTDMHLDITNNDYANGWKGVGGSRIANDPVESTDDPKYSIVLRYQNLPDDADLVIIAGGTNDWQHGNVELGDFDSTDIHTFNGALNELLLGLKLKYKYIPVVMLTPIKRGSEYNLPNKKGLYQEQFVDAMIAKCRQYGIYCLDMYSNCPLNPQIPELNETFFLPSKDGDGNIRYDEQGNIMYDATHPNTEGHKIMGRTVAGFIRTLS